MNFERTELTDKIDFHFAEYVDSIKNEIIKECDLSFQKDGYYIIITNHKTKNKIKLRIETEKHLSERATLGGKVWAMINGPKGETICLLEIDFIYFNENKVRDNFDKELKKHCKVSKVKSYIRFILKEEGKRLMNTV
ncbi:hypothetical protein [Paenibacillus sp. FSL P4-0288]|uniref:hypothetical protein n=1 Tax=Paenibacillus sp. FSL P4-0288 TaxID=2921633 RepID=UPI0030FB822B